MQIIYAYAYSYEDEQSTVNVRSYLYLHEKAPQIVSHVIKRSLLSLEARKYQVPSKLEHLCSNIHCWFPPHPMILALENTHHRSQVQYMRYTNFYKNFPPGFKSFSLRCVEANLKVSSHLHKRVQFPIICMREYKKCRTPFPHSPQNFTKTRLWNDLNPLRHFCTSIIERKKNITYSKARIPTALRNREIIRKWSNPP